MSTRGRRKCCHCGTWFKPHPRNASRQHHCMEPECRVASKRASQQKWWRKIPGYYHGEVHVERVQEWRRNHPGYWKRKATQTGPEPPVALQDLIHPQPVHEQLLMSLRNQLSEEISRPLQDLVTAQSHALVGLAAMITGEPLQEDIARVLTTCYERGQRIGGIVPWMHKQEVKHERTRADCAATAATGSPAVQLGRSSSGP